MSDASIISIWRASIRRKREAGSVRYTRGNGKVALLSSLFLSHCVSPRPILLLSCERDTYRRVRKQSSFLSLYIRAIYTRKVNSRWIFAWNEIETCFCFPFDKLFDQLLISCARVWGEIRARNHSYTRLFIHLVVSFGLSLSCKVRKL